MKKEGDMLIDRGKIMEREGDMMMDRGKRMKEGAK
jgi:hypothetical protein